MRNDEIKLDILSKRIFETIDKAQFELAEDERFFIVNFTEIIGVLELCKAEYIRRANYTLKDDDRRML